MRKAIIFAVGLLCGVGVTAYYFVAMHQPEIAPPPSPAPERRCTPAAHRVESQPARSLESQPARVTESQPTGQTQRQAEQSVQAPAAPVQVCGSEAAAAHAPQPAAARSRADAWRRSSTQ